MRSPKRAACRHPRHTTQILHQPDPSARRDRAGCPRRLARRRAEGWCGAVVRIVPAGSLMPPAVSAGLAAELNSFDVMCPWSRLAGGLRTGPWSVQGRLAEGAGEEHGSAAGVACGLLCLAVNAGRAGACVGLDVLREHLALQAAAVDGLPGGPHTPRGQRLRRGPGAWDVGRIAEGRGQGSRSGGSGADQDSHEHRQVSLFPHRRDVLGLGPEHELRPARAVRASGPGPLFKRW